jgi:hypothetical protein
MPYHMYDSRMPLGSRLVPRGTAHSFDRRNMLRSHVSVSGAFLKNSYRSYMIALAVALALSAGNAFAGMPEMQQQGDIPYISGGIGSDETDAIEAVKENYNLRVTSADKTGHFRGDTRIIVSDVTEDVLLDTITQGPLFYANLPKGRYTVYGYSEGQSKTQKVTITKGKTTRVHFSWPVSLQDMHNAATNHTVEPTIISPDPITVP